METLIQQLISEGYLKTSSIIEAFKYVDRKDFLPEEMKKHAYLNQALPIGYRQTISQPLVVAFMLELLEPKQGEKILEIGTGSGWQTALLSKLVGKEGSVTTIERIEELMRQAEKNLSTYQNENIKIIKGDGAKGYKERAPYDKIIAAATCVRVPSAWKSELKIGGYVVAPVGESIIQIEKKSAKEFKKKEYAGFRFVPLITDEKPRK